MKRYGVIALSAAALLTAGTISADAFPHGGFGGGFHGGGGYHGGAGFHAGAGGFHGGGFQGRGLQGGSFGAAHANASAIGRPQVAGGTDAGRMGGHRGGYGRALGYGLGGLGLYGLYDGYGSYGDYAYGYEDPAYSYGSYAYDPDYAGDGNPVMTGRSAAVEGLGKYCETPVKTCKLYNAASVGAGCSCKVTGGREEGEVTP